MDNNTPNNNNRFFNNNIKSGNTANNNGNASKNNISQKSDNAANNNVKIDRNVVENIEVNVKYDINTKYDVNISDDSDNIKSTNDVNKSGENSIPSDNNQNITNNSDNIENLKDTKEDFDHDPNESSQEGLSSDNNPEEGQDQNNTEEGQNQNNPEGGQDQNNPEEGQDQNNTNEGQNQNNTNSNEGQDQSNEAKSDSTSEDNNNLNNSSKAGLGNNSSPNNNENSNEANGGNENRQVNQNANSNMRNNQTNEGSDNTKRDADDFRNRSRQNQAQRGKESTDESDGDSGLSKGKQEEKKDESNNSDEKKSKLGQAKDKLNSISDKANKAAHPIETAKKKLQAEIDKKKKAILKKLLKSPTFWVIVGVCLALLLFVGLISSGSGNQTLCVFPDKKYDFTSYTIKYTEGDGSTIDVPYDKFIKSMVYEDLYMYFNNNYEVNFNFNVAVFSSVMVNNSFLLNIGGYKAGNNELEISSDLVSYCDYETNCNGNIAISTKNKGNLDSLYEQSKYYLLVDSSYDSPLVEQSKAINRISSYNYDTIFNYDFENNINELEDAYDFITTFSDYTSFKKYDLLRYIETFTARCGVSMMWPIGSSSPTIPESNIYDGTPMTVNITSEYGENEFHPTPHTGVDISIYGNVPIIAAADGTVTAVRSYCNNNGCGSNCFGNNYCNGNSSAAYCANYVYVEHADGLVTRYLHLRNGSVAVEAGEQVVAGQLIGYMGSTGCSSGQHLHFQVEKDGTVVDPMDYISADKPR